MTIEVGSGFFYDKETNYLIDFSENKYDWIASAYYSIMVVPPFDHPLFATVYRHEKEHAKIYMRLMKNSFIWFLFRFLTCSFLFEGFGELCVAIRSQSLHLWGTQKGNQITLLLSCFWIAAFFYSFFNLNVLIVLLGVILGVFVLWFRGDIH